MEGIGGCCVVCGFGIFMSMTSLLYLGTPVYLATALTVLCVVQCLAPLD